jgi:hypothetical protein
VALAVSAVLAIGFGALISHATARQPVPRLRTVPGAFLEQNGYSLASADQPPYCGAERSAVAHWVSTGQAGCAIGQDEARLSTLPIFQGTVREAVLARATGPDNSGLGRDRLVWLLVVRSSLLILPTTDCGPPRPSGPACQARHLDRPSDEVIVFVDATTGQVITMVAVPMPAAGASS